MISSKNGDLRNSEEAYVIEISTVKDYLKENENQHPLSERAKRYSKSFIDIQKQRTRCKSVEVDKIKAENQYISNKANSFQSSDLNGQDITLPVFLVDSIDDYIFPEEHDDL